MTGPARAPRPDVDDPVEVDASEADLASQRDYVDHGNDESDEPVLDADRVVPYPDDE